MDQSRKQNNAQNRAMNAQDRALAFEQEKYNTFSRPALERLMALAQGYDPVAESRGAVAAAERSAGDSIGRALRQHDVSYRAGGGTPGQTTNYGSRQASVMRPISQRLADMVADMSSNKTAKQAQMWQSVLGQAPAGQLGQAYFQNANALSQMANNTPGGDFGGVSRMLADMLGGMKPGGAGGRGDQRGILGGVDVGDSANQFMKGLF